MDDRRQMDPRFYQQQQQQQQSPPQQQQHRAYPDQRQEGSYDDGYGHPAPPIRQQGRSQTMTAQSGYQAFPGRTQTMPSNINPQHPGQMRQNGYPPPMPRDQQMSPNGYPPQQQQYQQQQRPPRLMHPSQLSHPQQFSPGPQGQGQMYPEQRRAFPQPTRVFSAGQPGMPGYQGGGYGPNGPAPGAMSRQPPPMRGYPPPGPGPALNSDPNRSRSMASVPYNHAPPPNLQPGFGRPGSGGPLPQQAMARTTGQGRIVPERHDERTMSLSSYGHERDHTQTMSGRVIPHRRKESDEAATPPAFNQQGRHNTMPAQANPNYNYAAKARTPSQASTASSQKTLSNSYDHLNSLNSRQTQPTAVVKSASSSTVTVTTASNASNHQAVITTSRRTPLVYPALLSRVAKVFRDILPTGDRIKNELAYKSAFTGSEAVDVIAYIIKTTDRNLALLLGRALDAQKFFHDVTYDHRLRDSQVEVYQFRERLVDEELEVNGVFTLLTECYSPTCTRDRLCYSIACPRRLEQQARLNLKPQSVLKRQDSRSSLHDGDDKEQKLWIQTVPKEIADSITEQEKKRQEVVCEAIYTERDFVKDLEYLRDFWIKPLRSNNPASPSPIPENRREKFIRTVFSNVLEVHAVNSKLAEALTVRQQQSAVVKNVGDIFLTYVPRFEPFIKYGANQLYGKYEFEKEKASNPVFAKFVDERERMKESRKLELNGYLTKPTTRLARYPLLLEAILKTTAEDNPDKEDLPKAIAMIREFLTKVNVESGKAENHFNLMQLSQQLVSTDEHVDLRLTEEGRQLIFKGSFKKTAAANDGSDILAFLFDHALLLVRSKTVNKREQYKVYKKPIPLELLAVSVDGEPVGQKPAIKRPSSSLIPGTNTKLAEAKRVDAAGGRGFPITLQFIGKRGFIVTLHSPTLAGRKKWIEHIETQQSTLKNRSNVYVKTILCEGFFGPTNRVNCLKPVDGSRKFVIGTDTGVFVLDRKMKDGQKAVPRKALDMTKIEQIDVLDEYAILLVLSERNVYSYSVETLDPNESQLNKRPKKIQGHTNFFKSGVCMGKQLVCCVKSSTMSSTVKVLEPLDTLAKSKKQPALRKFLQGGQDSLKPYKEFYIPAESSSIHFLRTKLCVGCAKGFEIVSLETLETQPLLDPADSSLDDIVKKDGAKPIAIYRFPGEFLLNYSDLSIFVNKNGWRVRPDWEVRWEGCPQSFCLAYPYLIAFEPSFIEIRSLETGGMVHIVVGKNIRMLYESTSREVIYAYEDEEGFDVIASLDWNKSVR